MSPRNGDLKVFRRRNGKCEGSFRCATIWLGGVWLLKRFNNKFYWTSIVNQRMPHSLYLFNTCKNYFYFRRKSRKVAKTSIKVRKIKTLNLCNFDLALLLVDSENSLKELNKYESEKKLAKVVFLQMNKGIKRVQKEKSLYL